MSDKKITHMLNIPDCTFALFITHDGTGINISCGDFVTEDIIDTDMHRVIADIGDSLLLLVKDVIEQAEERFKKEEEPAVEVTKERGTNLIHINFNSKTKH